MIQGQTWLFVTKDIASKTTNQIFIMLCIKFVPGITNVLLPYCFTVLLVNILGFQLNVCISGLLSA